jgi:hypothetical protein
MLGQPSVAQKLRSIAGSLIVVNAPLAVARA